jgi:signal transduction histidine kinase
MGLGTDRPHDFEIQNEYLETLAAAVALGLQNALLFEQTRQTAQDLETEVRKRTQELETSQKALMTSLADVKKTKLAIEAANERLKELDRLKSMFIASMSHELRTPLNSIIGFTGILLQGLAGELNEEQKDQLGRVSRAGKHLLALISDVIDVSKIEAGKIDLCPEDVELEKLIAEAMATIAKEAAQKGLTLHVDVAKPIRIHTDRRRLFQCLINLLSNAVKYSEHGSVVVTARPLNQEVSIRITDNGIGIAEADMQLLFKSFVRLESHLKTKTPGTGLGLYLTRKIVSDLLGGEIRVKSRLGKGSAFEIIVPVSFFPAE